MTLHCKKTDGTHPVADEDKACAAAGIKATSLKYKVKKIGD